MKTKLNLFQARTFCVVAMGIGLSSSLGAAADWADSAPTKSSAAIPWSQIGAKAGADYQGDGLAVIPTADGARLRCVFQKLEGEATRGGLWLTSTVTNAPNERFRVVAAEVGRKSSNQDVAADVSPLHLKSGEVRADSRRLLRDGNVSVDGQTVRFSRPGLTEEYTVSMDGVRQDFIIEHPPLNSQLSTLSQLTGELVVRLAVTGAKVEPAVGGARLVLENSGRKIAYSRLRVTDATGKELTARMEVMGSARVPRAGSGVAPEPFSAIPSHDWSEEISVGRGFRRDAENYTPEACAPMLAVLVNDADAVYPVRIDPTFSDANWMSMGGVPGANSGVSAAVVDGSGNLYIGGEFTVVGDVSANRIAKWNGSSWSALGSGLDYFVYALAVSGSDVYAGGAFTAAGGTAANYIAKWNGSTWMALGSGMGGVPLGPNPWVFAVVVSGGDLYAGGRFTTAGGTAANYIAKWNGSSWTALGSGMGGSLNPFVSALAVSGSNVYAGGNFTVAGGSPANYIAKWNGSSWSALDSGLGGAYPYVDALAVSGSDVYAGGGFTTAGGSAANYIAKWDGNIWTALGSGMGSSLSPYPHVYALAVSGSDLYAGGHFTTAGGNAANFIAKWNGSNWTALSSGMNDWVYALAVSGSNVYAGGSFGGASGSAANFIAKWNGTSWSSLGSGMGSSLSPYPYVYALAVAGSNVYVGGDFTTVGGSAATNIAKWDGSSWTALGSGINDWVYALAVSPSDVYAGGEFTTAGGSAANYVAKWNGSNWSALGSGMNDSVRALAVLGSNVYAGGSFTTAGGNEAGYVAQWDGNSWTALGSGMNGFGVYALAVSGSNLYAGGEFTTAGGSAANYVAKWNGSSWSSLGSGMGDGFTYVSALAVSGSDLYAGGYFTTAGDSAANYVSKWDGDSWTALGSGMNGTVFVLTVSGSDLYAGGDFATATNNGGATVTANRIAKWDGNSWSALGSGMNAQVSALAVSGNEMYVGGSFTTAGGKVSAYIARAYLPTLPTVSVLRSGMDIMVSWPSVDADGFALEQAGLLAAPAGWVTNSATVTDDGTNKSVTLPATNTSQFFRLRRP